MAMWRVYFLGGSEILVEADYLVVVGTEGSSPVLQLQDEGANAVAAFNNNACIGIAREDLAKRD